MLGRRPAVPDDMPSVIQGIRAARPDAPSVAPITERMPGADPEVLAMAGLAYLLNGLERDSIQRVLGWARGRYLGDNSNGQSNQAAMAPSDGTRGGDGAATAPHPHSR